MKKVIELVSNILDLNVQEEEMEWEIKGFDPVFSSMDRYFWGAPNPQKRIAYETNIGTKTSYFRAPEYIFKSVEEEIDGSKWYFEASVGIAELPTGSNNTFKFKFFVDDHEADENSCYQFEVQDCFGERKIMETWGVRNTSGARCILQTDPADTISTQGFIPSQSENSYKLRIRCRKLSYVSDTKTETERQSQPISIDDEVEGEPSAESEVLMEPNAIESDRNIITDEAAIESSFENVATIETEETSSSALPVKYSEACEIQDPKKANAIDSVPFKAKRKRSKRKHVRSSASEINQSDSTSDNEEEIMSVQKHEKIAKRIRKIYLTKMKQVADTSSRLFLAAATLNIDDLLLESCRSLAAQLTLANFTEIWDIANELKADELKKLVVQFIVENYEHLVCDERITPELMMEVFIVKFHQNSAHMDPAISESSKPTD